MNRGIVSGEIECKEGLNRKNKSLKKTIKLRADRELSGSELEEVIQRHQERLAGTMGWPAVRTEELSAMVKEPIVGPDVLSAIMGQQSNQKWKEAESTQSHWGRGVNYPVGT